MAEDEAKAQADVQNQQADQGEFRIEHDTMGEVRVPAHAKWSAQTQRAVENFPISGVTVEPAQVHALARIKGAAARVNARLGVIDQDVADAIVQAADAVVAGDWDDHFPIDVYQTGSGTSTNMNVNEVLATLAVERLGRPGVHPEGRFFPDTYTYAKGSSDLALLRRALHAMDRKLEVAWAQRAADLPLKTPDEALVLASIVEKETGRASDRGQIAGVFVNRLRAGMLLQTDPTVIYGMGEAFDGNLRKKDLQTDTPWNTYTRAGLPPTPIAMPGKAALLAAVQPEPTRNLYFVAKGDGTSHFSPSLEEHNRAVTRYQRGQQQGRP